MDIKLIVALIGLASILVTALVQFYLGTRSEKNKKLLEIKTEAYIDLINIVSEIAISAQNNNDRSIEQLQKLTKAKSRIALIGSSNVVNELHRFFTTEKSLVSLKSQEKFTALASAMRDDLSASMVNKIVLLESLFERKL